MVPMLCGVLGTGRARLRHQLSQRSEVERRAIYRQDLAMFHAWAGICYVDQDGLQLIEILPVCLHLQSAV